MGIKRTIDCRIALRVCIEFTYIGIIYMRGEYGSNSQLDAEQRSLFNATP